ncbi:MAG: hypothetical protein AAGE52_17980 [Myxococcota bacterium]
MEDADAVDAGLDAADLVDADRADAASDAAEDVGCTSHAECAASTGFPPVPEVPCGSCWAACGGLSDVGGVPGECGTICFEARDCVFTAGCGPACEPLCETSDDCLLDMPCIDGVCVDTTE